MNVQDMYAESVAFLERAVTQVARIFPVSLVNTSGVLKMLVSIILVSKHFTTPVTSEAVPTCCRKTQSVQLFFMTLMNGSQNCYKAKKRPLRT